MMMMNLTMMNLSCSDHRTTTTPYPTNMSTATVSVQALTQKSLISRQLVNLTNTNFQTQPEPHTSTANTYNGETMGVRTQYQYHASQSQSQSQSTIRQDGFCRPNLFYLYRQVSMLEYVAFVALLHINPSRLLFGDETETQLKLKAAENRACGCGLWVGQIHRQRSGGRHSGSSFYGMYGQQKTSHPFVGSGGRR